MNKDTKTTVLGIVAAIAAGLLTPQAVAIEPVWLHSIASWTLTIGLGLLGWHSAGIDPKDSQ